MAQGAYCHLSGCTVFCSPVPTTGADQWVWGPSPYINYSITNFCQYFPQAGFTVPSYCLPPQSSPPPPPGTGGGQSLPPPPPGVVGQPVEVQPPPVGSTYVPTKPITGEDGPPEDAPPPEAPPSLCKPSMETAPPAMAVPAGDNFSSEGKHGYSSADFMRSAQTGSLTAIPKFSQAAVSNHEDPNKASPISYITQPKVVVNKDGGIEIYKPGTTEGYLVFHSPDLEAYQLHGSGILPGSRWPTNIAASILLIHSGPRDDSSTGDVAAQKLAFGLPSKTRGYPRDGFVFDHDGTSGAPQLYLRETDSAGDLSTSCVGTFNIRTKLDVLCNANFQGDVDIDGSLTVGGSPVGSEWTTITANTVDATPVTAALDDDFSAEGAYTIIAEVIAYDQLNQTSLHQTFRHGFTQAGGTNDMVSVGVMDDDLMDEAGFTTTGVSFTTDGVSTVTASFQGPESDVCWTLRYRILYQGVC